MSYAAESDPLWYPGTSILRNLLDLRDQRKLDEAETALFIARAANDLPPGSFDADHYKALHRHLFGDVYAWAGETRTIRIAKGGNWFCYPEHIPKELDRAFREYGIPDEVFALPREDFVLRTARLLSELNAVHPFREGNGRTQLVYFTMLAREAQHPLDMNVFEPERVIHAMISGFAGDEIPLRQLIGDAIRGAER